MDNRDYAPVKTDLVGVCCFLFVEPHSDRDHNNQNHCDVGGCDCSEGETALAFVRYFIGPDFGLEAEETEVNYFSDP